MSQSSPSYAALLECAMRRLDHEWLLSSNAVALLRLVAEFSFGCSQLWASIPTHKHFCVLSGLHKSSVSRELKKLIDQGLLEVRLRKDETLYFFNVYAEGIPLRKQSAEAEALRAELLALQYRRNGGQCDADGQMRLAQVINDPAEDVSLEGMALRAMLEAPVATEVTSCRTATAPVFPAPVETNDEPTTSLNRLERAFEVGQKSRVAELQPRNTLQSKTRLVSETDRQDESVSNVVEEIGVQTEDGELSPEFERLAQSTEGFTQKQSEVWRMLVTEISHGSYAGKADFKQFERWWRGEVRKHPHAVYEGCANHRLMRDSQGAATHPGKVISAGMKQALNLASAS